MVPVNAAGRAVVGVKTAVALGHYHVAVLKGRDKRFNAALVQLFQSALQQYLRPRGWRAVAAAGGRVFRAYIEAPQVLHLASDVDRSVVLLAAGAGYLHSRVVFLGFGILCVVFTQTLHNQLSGFAGGAVRRLAYNVRRFVVQVAQPPADLAHPVVVEVELYNGHCALYASSVRA